MKKTNLFIFWLGDKKLIKKNSYDRKTFDVYIGPTETEHKYLLDNYPYYKTSFEDKKYSFCSDVGRLYILSKHKGLYIDASVKTGDNINEYLEDGEKFKVVLFRGNFKYIESGVMWSGEDHNKFFGDLLDFYYKRDLSTATFIMPVFLSKRIFENGFSAGGDAQVVEELKIKILPLDFIRDKSRIGKTVVGSGSPDSSITSNDYFKKAETFDRGKPGHEKYINRTIDAEYLLKVQRALEGGITDVTLLRQFYDAAVRSKSFENILKLEDEYRKIKYQKRFKELLIGSKLYRFFKRFEREKSK